MVEHMDSIWMKRGHTRAGKRSPPGTRNSKGTKREPYDGSMMGHMKAELNWLIAQHISSVLEDF